METIGYYITCDDALCVKCFARAYVAPGSSFDWRMAVDAWRTQGGFEGWSEPLAIFSETKSDMPTHCAECGELIPHNLTHDGLRYVIDQAIENPESQAIAEWLDTYFETGGPYFDRFDIAEAYACAAYDLNGSDWASKVQAQLARLRFRMSPMIDYQPYRLEGNSLAIYIETMRRQGAA